MSWRLLLDDLRQLPTFLRMGSALRRASGNGRETLATLIRSQAQRWPDKVALRFEREAITYEELNDGANAFAAIFAEAGIGREPVALMMENSPALLMAQTGVAKIGAIGALVNTHITGEALRHALLTSTARHVFCDARSLPAAAEAAAGLGLTIWAQGDAPAGVEPLDSAWAAAKRSEPASIDVRGRDLFLYIYTSGTTGFPKPAIIRHSRFTMAGIALGGMFGIGSDDVIYAPLPLYHGESNFVGFSVAMRAGATFASRSRFSATEFLPDARRHGATMFVYVGELCRYLLQQPPSPADRDHSIRLAAGAGLRPDIWEDFRSRFGIDRIVEMYGMTEGNLNLMNLSGRTGSVGRPHPFQHRNVRVARFDFERQDLQRGSDGYAIECGPGEPGELLGRIAKGGYMPYDGYTDRHASEARIARDVFRRGDAWFRSGDLLHKDDDGYYYFDDRIGDTFRWKGENVATLEVAEVLNRAPGIRESVVFGVRLPHADGRVGAAAIVLQAPASFDPEMFYQHAKQHLPAYARPAFVRLVPSLSATGTLKLRKVELARDGYDRTRVSDPIYVRDDETATYIPLTEELVQRITIGRMRF